MCIACLRIKKAGATEVTPESPSAGGKAGEEGTSPEEVLRESELVGKLALAERCRGQRPVEQGLSGPAARPSLRRDGRGRLETMRGYTIPRTSLIYNIQFFCQIVESYAFLTSGPSPVSVTR